MTVMPLLKAMKAESTPATRPVLRLSGVTKAFNSVIALDNVSFSINPGEVVALLGPSGAGKSTIFRCISRLAEVDAGHVTVLGQDVGDRKSVV